MISDKHLGMFLTTMTAKNFTEDTKRAYKSMLLIFGRDFNGRYDRATIDELTSYISRIDNVNYMASTYGALKHFYFYVLKQKQKFPFIPFPKKESRLPKVPSKDKILEAIEKTKNTKHRLIVMLLYGTGIRLMEITHIKWSDIRREKGELNPLSILIRGKGNKDRIVPISKKINELLIEYCREYNLKCDTDKAHYIFGGEVPYSRRSVANVVRDSGNRVGLDLHPHLLRHSCFTHLRDSGVDIETIGELAGHASPITTKKYARLNPVRIQMPC